MEIPILYESKWLLAINKPAGLVVEQAPHFPSVEDWAQHYISKYEKKTYVGIIHRLDRSVSGALLLAKRKAALKDLNEQFRERRVQKTYLALVENEPPQAQGTLTHWLRKDQAAKKALVFDKKVKDSVECRLDYKIAGKNDAGFILEIQLHTGKFHQIRAQLAAIGCPILGDSKYGAILPYQPEAIALHAWRLSFLDPLTSDQILLEAPLPMPFSFQ